MPPRPQDSTRLWELLPPSTMDSAIDLHHACLRTCSAAHCGYEALTEGDSFTLAFHTPHAALAFCLAAQEALMRQDWPPELLEVRVRQGLLRQTNAIVMFAWVYVYTARVVGSSAGLDAVAGTAAEERVAHEAGVADALSMRLHLGARILRGG